LQVFKNPSQNLIGTDVCHCQTTHCGINSIGSAKQYVTTQTDISGLQYGEGRRRVEGGFDHKINNDYITGSKCHHYLFPSFSKPTIFAPTQAVSANFIQDSKSLTF
jgi:hypothetical protein